MMITIMRKTTFLTGVLAAVFFISCQEHHVTRQTVAVDSLINAAYQSRDYDSILSLADIRQHDGTLSDQKAFYWRGYAYSRQRKMRMAEMEWKKAMAQGVDGEKLRAGAKDLLLSLELFLVIGDKPVRVKGL